jgi:hypothetical protein
MSRATAPTFSPFEIDLAAIEALPEPQRTAALQEVAAINAKVKANKLWRFRPHEGEKERKLRDGEPLDGEESRGQVEYLEMNWRQVYFGAAVAGNRFGKTEIGLVDNLIQTLPPAFIPPWLERYRKRPYDGDIRIRFVVVDLPNALKKVWLPKMRRMIPPDALWKGDFGKAWNERDRLLTFADGSWWDFLTHDMDVDAFSGADLDRVQWDEEPPGAKGYLQFDESSWRLLDRDGDMRFTGTPLLGYSWLYYELTENDVPRKDDEAYVVEGSIDDNPTMSKAAIDRQIKRYEKKDPGKLEARRHGRFVHFAGLIYPEFRETVPEKGGHIIAAGTIPRASQELDELGIPIARPSVPVYATIDPGVDHPAALSFFYLSAADIAVYFYAQKWANGDVDDLAHEYQRVLQDYNLVPRWTVIDPASKNRSSIDKRNFKDVLARKHGIHTIPANNVVNAGINEVRERLKSGRLLVWSDQDQLIDEFKTYRWKNRKGQGEDEARLEPVKRNDDIIDTVRYGLMSLPQKAKPEEAEATDEQRLERRLLRENLKRLRKNRRGRVGSAR